MKRTMHRTVKNKSSGKKFTGIPDAWKNLQSLRGILKPVKKTRKVVEEFLAERKKEALNE